MLAPAAPVTGDPGVPLLPGGPDWLGVPAEKFSKLGEGWKPKLALN